MESNSSIIIIDDDEHLCKSMSKIFKEEGFETETAKTGHEAIEKVEKKYFNIALLDLKLPDIEGTELLLSLKEMYHDMDIIMITGNAEMESAIKALNRGASAYIRKPLNIEDLLTNVRNLIEKQSLLAENQRMEKKLKESIESYKELETIVNTSPAVVFLWKNKEGWPVEYVSENIKQFGYTPEEFYSGELPYSEIIHHDDLERVGVDVNLYSMEGVQEFEQEYRIITKSGEICYIDDHTWIRRNQKGEITHYQGIILNITNRKELEEKLKKSEEKYRLITENANDLIIVLNQNLECEYVNEQVSMKIWGYTSNDLIGKSVRNLIHPDDLNIAIISLRKGAKVGESEGVLRVRKKDSQYAWFEITRKVFFDEKGERKVLLISRDVTAHKKVEERMMLLSSAMEQSTEGIAVSDLKGNLLFANNAFSDMHGYTSNELICNHLSIFHTPDQILSVEAANQQLLEQREFNGEIWHLRKDGSVFPSLMHNSLFNDDMNNPVGMIGILLDITEKKEAEEKLRKSEEKYRFIIENANDLIFILNQNMKLEYINENVLKKLLGFSKKDIIGKSNVDFIFSEDIDRTLKLFRKGFKSGQGMVELRCLDTSGLYHWLEIKGKTFIDQDGKTKGLFIARDITERKKREEELEKTYSKLNQIFNITIPLCVIDKKFNILRINDTFSSMYNVKREEIIGRKCYDIISGRLCNTPECTMRQILDGKDHWDYEKDLELANGIKITCNMRAVQYRGPDDEIIGVIENYTDITKRKKIEDMLKLNKERYSLATNAAKVGVWDWNIENGEFYLDPNIKMILGYSDEEIPNDLDAWVKYVHPDDSKGVMEAAQAHLEGKTSEYIYEHRMLHKDGSIRWVQVRGRAIRDTQGNAIRMVGTDTDITAQKEAEVKLKISETKLKILNKELEQMVEEKIKELRESEEKYRTLFEQAADSIILIDTETGDLIDFNNKMNETLGYTREEFKKLKIPDFDIMENSDEYKAHVMKVVKEGSDSFETKYITKNGEIRNIFVNAKAIRIKEKNYLQSILQDITERKKAEEAQRESEEKYRAIFEHAGNTIFLENNKEEILDANLAASKLFGYTHEELLKMKTSDLQPPTEQRLPIYSNPDIVFMNPIEKTGLCCDGTQISVEVDITPLKRKKDTLFLSIVRDITERKQIEDKIREREKLLSNTFASIQDGICVIDKDNNIIRANPTIEKWYSHMKPILAKKCYNVLYNKSQPCKDCLCQKLIEKCEPTSKINFRKTPDGKIIKVLDSYMFPLLDHDTGEIEGVINYIRDITERYSAQVQLKESEEKIRNMINNISDVLMEGDMDGTITYISPQIYDINGYQSKELIGLKIIKFFYPEEKITYKKLINKPSKSGDKFSMELRVLHKKGYYVPISVKGSVVEVNNRLKFFAVISDITEKRKIDDMMKREIKKLKTLDQIRSDLIRRISHELKTPLISILSGSQYLLDYSSVKIDEEIRKFLKIIHKGGHRLRNLVDNLITTYDIESNELKLELKRENIIQIIKDCIEDIMFQAKKRNLFVNIELLNELYFDVDKSKISLVISEILLNAVRNTPPGGSIFIKTFEHHNYIDIIIKDTGVGFTRKEIPILFKKFGKIERFGKGLVVDIEGPGLGLYISKEIVKMHKGEILLKSKGRNKGSTFIIRLYVS